MWDAGCLLSNNIQYGIFGELPFTLAIGTNGGGEFIGMEHIAGGACRIVLSPFIGLDARDHREIGNSFTDFLVRLDEGKEWFE